MYDFFDIWKVRHIINFYPLDYTVSINDKLSVEIHCVLLVLLIEI